jgi:single-stranded-DNA-specific exonuclease
MGQIDLALNLFLTDDENEAADLARQLCDLNRQRQAVESQIYAQAVSMLPDGQPPEAIVLADDSWHQGVVGIVASRMAEEYCCPAFLICLDGEHGKASSRSFGGFNLFSSLTALAPLLESYGGHELAAGFTIARHNIPRFRDDICAIAADYYLGSGPRTVLDIDCTIPPELMTVRSIEALNILEPCGNGCPKPVFAMERLSIERITMVGGGRHMRLRLRSGHHTLNAIYFSATPETASIEQGDLVDVAFNAQINEFRGERSVQMNVLDIRPSCSAEASPELYEHARIRSGVSPASAEKLLPDRQTLGDVWRYLAASGASLQENPICLCRKIVRRSGRPLSVGKLLTCLDIFADVGLLSLQRQHKYIRIDLNQTSGKADLNQSNTMQLLLQAKGS